MPPAHSVVHSRAVKPLHSATNRQANTPPDVLIVITWSPLVFELSLEQQWPI